MRAPHPRYRLQMGTRARTITTLKAALLRYCSESFDRAFSMPDFECYLHLEYPDGRVIEPLFFSSNLDKEGRTNTDHSVIFSEAEGVDSHRPVFRCQSEVYREHYYVPTHGRMEFAIVVNDVRIVITTMAIFDNTPSASFEHFADDVIEWTLRNACEVTARWRKLADSTCQSQNRDGITQNIVAVAACLNDELISEDRI